MTNGLNKRVEKEKKKKILPVKIKQKQSILSYIRLKTNQGDLNYKAYLFTSNLNGDSFLKILKSPLMIFT